MTESTPNNQGQSILGQLIPSLAIGLTVLALGATTAFAGTRVQERFFLASAAPVIPATVAPCEVTYGGRITTANGDKATFGGNATAAGPSGQEQFQDHGPAADLNVHSIAVSAVTCSPDGTAASILGTATVDGGSIVDFQIDVTDLGEPGRSDTYRLALSTGYDTGIQLLEGGNVQIHKSVAAPVATPAVTPVPSPVATPVPSASAAPVASIPVATPVPTPAATPVATPVPAPAVTPVPTARPAPLPATTVAACKVTYGGRITAANGDKATFGGNATSVGPSGQEQFQDHGPIARLKVHSIALSAVTCSPDGTAASILGTATVKGVGPVDFQIDVTDLGEPGRSDTYRLALSTGYDSGIQLLRGGNVQIHTRK